MDGKNLVGESSKWTMKACQADTDSDPTENVLTGVIIGWYSLELDVVERFDCKRSVGKLMSHPQWAEVFSWRGDTYGPVIYEFISSLKFKDKIANDNRISISFSLFGQEYHLSTNQLARSLGLFDQEGLLEDFPSDLEAQTFLNMHNRSIEFQRVDNAFCHHLARKDFRIVRRLLSHNLGKLDAEKDKITREDLFYLWSMDTGMSINMGRICKRWLQEQRRRQLKVIFVGPLLARLCWGLELQKELFKGEILGRISSMPVAEIEAMGIQPVPRTVIVEKRREPAPVCPGPTRCTRHETEVRNPYLPIVPSRYPRVTDWASMSAFQYQLHLETMNVLLNVFGASSAPQGNHHEDNEEDGDSSPP